MRGALVMRALNERPAEWRYGQAVFNYAHEVCPQAVDRLRGGPLDCFHFDGRVAAFLDALEADGALGGGR